MAFACAALLGLTGCRKEQPQGEQPSGGSPSATAARAEAAAPGPSIHQTAEAGRPPFSALRSPRAASVDDQGRLWIIDAGNAAVKIFDSAGGYLGGWGGPGTGTYGLRNPFGISVRGDDVYVADTFGVGVELFSLSGEWKAKANAGLYGPRGVAAARDGRVWIADTGHDRVVVCDRNLTNPRSIGKKGAGPEEFNGPMGIAAGPSGRVYVADTVNRRIQVLDSDGTFRAHWPFKRFELNGESCIAVDQDETLYVSDQGSAPAVIHLDNSGNELQRWTADEAGAKLNRPTGLAIDQKTRTLYVVNADSVKKIKLSLK